MTLITDIKSAPQYEFLTFSERKTLSEKVAATLSDETLSPLQSAKLEADVAETFGVTGIDRKLDPLAATPDIEPDLVRHYGAHIPVDFGVSVADEETLGLTRSWWQDLKEYAWRQDDYYTAHMAMKRAYEEEDFDALREAYRTIQETKKLDEFDPINRKGILRYGLQGLAAITTRQVQSVAAYPKTFGVITALGIPFGPAGVAKTAYYGLLTSSFLASKDEFQGMMLEDAMDKGYDLDLAAKVSIAPSYVYAGLDLLELSTLKTGLGLDAKAGLKRYLKSKTLDYMYRFMKNYSGTLTKESLQEAIQRGVEETTKDAMEYLTYEGWAPGETTWGKLKELTSAMTEEFFGAAKEFALVPIAGAFSSATIDTTQLRDLESRLTAKEIADLQSRSTDSLERLRILAKLSRSEGFEDIGSTLDAHKSRYDMELEASKKLDENQDALTEAERDYGLRTESLRSGTDSQWGDFLKKLLESSEFALPKQDALELQEQMKKQQVRFDTFRTGVKDLDLYLRNPSRARDVGVVLQGTSLNFKQLERFFVANKLKALKELNPNATEKDALQALADEWTVASEKLGDVGGPYRSPLPFVLMTKHPSGEETVEHSPLSSFVLLRKLGLTKVPVLFVHQGYGSREDGTFDGYVPKGVFLDADALSPNLYWLSRHVYKNVIDRTTLVSQKELVRVEEQLRSINNKIRDTFEKIKSYVTAQAIPTIKDMVSYKTLEFVTDKALQDLKNTNYGGSELGYATFGRWFDEVESDALKFKPVPHVTINPLSIAIMADKNPEAQAQQVANELVDTIVHELAHPFAGHENDEVFTEILDHYIKETDDDLEDLKAEIYDFLEDNNYAELKKLNTLNASLFDLLSRAKTSIFHSQGTVLERKAPERLSAPKPRKKKKRRRPERGEAVEPATLRGRYGTRYGPNKRGVTILKEVRFKDKKLFMEKSFRSTKVGGVSVVKGRLKEGGYAVYKITFPETWTQGQVNAWLKEHRLTKEGPTNVEDSATLKKASKPEVVVTTKRITKKLERFRPSRIVAAMARAFGVESTKVSDQKFGKDISARILQAIFTPEAAVELAFARHRTSRGDTLEELEREINELPLDVRRAIMDARGVARTKKGQAIQEAAIAKLTPYQLKLADLVQEAADYNLAVMKELGFDVGKFEAYFYGVYKDPERVALVLRDNKTSTDKFLKEKLIPTVADARGYGLELLDNNPIANLRREFTAVMHLKAMEDLAQDMMKWGKGIYIEKEEKAPEGWKRPGFGRYTEPAFKGLRIHPDVVRVLDNLISTNLFTKNETLRGMRRISYAIQSVKFLFPLFHFRTMFTAALTDINMMNFFNPLRWPHNVKTAFLSGMMKLNKDELLTVMGKDHKLYYDYLLSGGGKHFSIEVSAYRAIEDFLVGSKLGELTEKLTRWPRWGARIVTWPWRKTNGWIFDTYIPAVKYAKYRDAVLEHVRQTGEYPSQARRVEIIKEIQNVYGEMNERLFGRSGTMTSFLRILFLAPGFAEGNFRTIGKALLQGRAGTISRANAVQGFLVLGVLTAIARRLFEDKWPEPPEDLDSFRDFFKLRTGHKDSKGEEIILDLMTYEKDYWDGLVKPLLLSAAAFKETGPVSATGTFASEMTNEMIRRTKTMASPALKTAADLLEVWQKGYVYDWKGDQVIKITDTTLQKLVKFITYESQNFEPIGMSAYKRLRRETSISALGSVVASVVGIRMTQTERDIKQNKLRAQMWSLKDQKTSLGYELAYVDAPQDVVDDYNETVKRAFSDPYVSEELLKEMGLSEEKLHLDVDKLLAAKVYRLTNPNLSDMEARRIVRYLKNFELTNPTQYRRYLKKYFRARDLSYDTQVERLRRLSSRIRSSGNLVTK